MATEELVVKLTAKTEAEKIRSFGKDLRALDKEYAHVQKSGKEYATSLEGLSRKHEIVGKKIQKQSEQLKAQKKRREEIARQLKNNKEKLDALNKSEDVDEKTKARLESTIKRQSTAYENLTRGIKENESGLKMLKEQQNALAGAKHIQAVTAHNQVYKEMAQNTIAAGQRLQGVGEKMNSVGNSMIALGAPLVGLGVKAFNAAKDYESAFAGVRKTTDATEAEYKKLSDTFIDMSKRMPTTAAEIAGVAEAAGQLGVKKEDLAKFSEVMVKLGDTTNLSAEEAAMSLAKFANVTGMSLDDVDRLGSVIVDLGNNMATTEADIVSMATRLGKTGSQIGLTQEQIMAFSAALSSVGIEAEAGGSAMSKLMINMSTATARGGEELEKFAQVAGMSASEFKHAFETNAAGAIQSFVHGLANVQESGGNVMLTLDEMGIKEVRMRDAVLGLVNASGKLDEALKISNGAWNENNALTKEANERYNTTESKLKMAKNELTAAAISLGNDLIPIATDAIKMLSKVVEWFNNLSPATKKAIVAFGAFSVAGGGVLKVVGNVVGGLGRAKEAFGRFALNSVEAATASGKLVKGMGGIATSAGTAATGTGKLTTLFAGGLNPALLGVGAAVAAVGAGVAIYNKNQELANKTILETTENTGFLDRVVAGFRGQTIKTREELQEMGYVYKDLGDVSEGFAAKLNDSAAKVRDFEMYLHEISLDDVLTDEEIQGFQTRVDGICDTAIQTVKGKQEAGQRELKELLASDGVFSKADAEFAEIMGRIGNDTVKKMETLKGEINSIKQKAVDERRGLNEQEIQDVTEKTMEISRLELESLASTEEEMLAAKNDFIARASNLDLEGMSALLVEKAKKRDEEIIQIQTDYDTKIQMAEKSLSSLSGKEKKFVEERIELLKEDKKRAIETKQQEYDGLLDVIHEKYPEMIKDIDLYSGQMLSDQDRVEKQKFETFFNNMEGIKKTSQSGWQYVKNKTTGEMEQVYVEIDEKTGKVRGAWSETTNEVVAGTEKQKQSMENLRKRHRGDTESILSDLMKAKIGGTEWQEATQEQTKKIIGDMKDVKVQADGTKEGIIKLNGHPVKVKVNSRGTIDNLQEIMDNLARIRSKEITITTYRDEYIRSFDYRSSGSYLKFGGGTNLDAGVYGVNESWHGWELIDTPFGTNPVRLADMKRYDEVFLPRGTSVTSHLASTEMMRKDIAKEVQRQISSIDFSSPYLRRNSLESKRFASRPVASQGGFDFNMADFAKMIVESIKEGFSNAEVNTVVNVDGGGAAVMSDADLDYRIAMMKKRRR